jgi:hypothetical protein
VVQGRHSPDALAIIHVFCFASNPRQAAWEPPKSGPDRGRQHSTVSHSEVFSKLGYSCHPDLAMDASTAARNELSLGSVDSENSASSHRKSA